MPTPIEDFKKTFLGAVRSRGIKKHWTHQQQMDATLYAKTLISPGNAELPKINTRVARVVNNSFAYGCALYAGQFDPTTMVGGRQEGFEELFVRSAAALAQRQAKLRARKDSQKQKGKSSASRNGKVVDIKVARHHRGTRNPGKFDGATVDAS